MRRLLITLLVLAAIVVGICFYLHIFTVDQKKLNEEEQKLNQEIKQAPGDIKKDLNNATGK